MAADVYRRALPERSADSFAAWPAARLEDLDYGDIDGIVMATRKHPSKE